MHESRHLLADGYNLAHAWPETRRRVKSDPAAAAEWVVRRVRAIHDHLGWAVTVVFDGNREERTIEHPDGAETLTIVHAARGETADAVIELILGRAPNAEGWVVATDDHALGQSAIASRAEVLGAAATASWIERTELEATQRLQRRRSRQAEPLNPLWPSTGGGR